MSWSPWLRLADKSWFYVEQKIWRPVVYELGLGPADAAGVEPEVVYVGTAPHEDALFQALEGASHPVSAPLRAALQAGRVLYYRVQARAEEAEVEALREALLERGPYPWNALAG